MSYDISWNLPNAKSRASIGARIAIAVGLCAMLSGCATGWSEAEKAKLSQVMVAPATVAKDCYQKPDATVSPGMANSIPVATGGGLIPALVGSAIDAAVMSKQQREFESTQAKYFPDLAKLFTVPPAAEVAEGIKRALGKQDFFASRVAEQAPAVFKTEIVRYGLMKSSDAKPGVDPKLSLRIIAKIELTLPDGTVLYSTQATGTSSRELSASEILNDPDFVKTSMAEAADSVGEQLRWKIGTKLEKK
jgi:hypothetical protein